MKTLFKSIYIITIATFLSSCVQETHLKTFHFKVDMSGIENINNPSVKGQFTTPSWEKAIPLTDADGDSIYEANVEIQAAQFGIHFKFVNNDEYELQDQNNRFIKFEYEPENFTYEAIYNNSESKITKN
ncbi:MAG: hypothetical protein ED556_07160 [Winogradskyella sp.]|uniref:hypothetical protein n=1 Tax=Winogradskyella sp. TaxID=1883156 RepID=UPI000F3BE448|nr:hypothetical protein [Winogradskyella sp.]RNC87192.1 MAG: hypothetical protein ED556_07160 [Winogradskyella sp.]